MVAPDESSNPLNNKDTQKKHFSFVCEAEGTSSTSACNDQLYTWNLSR